jgi:hypothetical protein
VRRSIVVVASLLALVVMPAAVSAQGGLGAPDRRDRFTDEYPFPDFCGTGVTVQVVEKTVGNIWEGENTFKVTFRSHVTWIYGDRTLIEQDAGRVLITTEGDSEGAHTEFVIENGIRAALRIPGQGMLTLDHGFIDYVATFDENGEFESVQVLKDAGGHPAFDSDVFCDAAIEALGIPTE